ncbi:MAG: TonB-dependent receptor [Acidobacteriota bacterium]|nr:TonB-dependent receptor [Acidobacteriota bacterium]
MKQLTVAALLCCLLAGTGPAAAAGAGYAGRPLADVLQELRAGGLRLVFTTRTVDAGMLVAAEPGATEPRAILAELLAPHGLEAREGAGGTLVVVKSPRPAPAQRTVIAGTVRNRQGLAPVAGVEIRLLEAAGRAVSGGDGSFRLVAPGAGPFTLEARRPGFVVARLAGIASGRGEPAAVSFVLDPAPVLAEDLVVTPSRVSLLHEAPAAPLALSRSDILALPQLGDDFFRALSLLPGVAANDVSAEFHLRGARRNETQILLDGQELYETYHVKDFDNAVSIVAPSTLEKVELSTGGFSVEHGDRMSGVLDMTTVRPFGPRRIRIAASVLTQQAGGAGTMARGRGSWLLEGRRGSLDLVDLLVQRNENPRYWDVFGKVDYQLAGGDSLRANVLRSVDELSFVEGAGEASKSLATEYGSSYLWLTHQAVLGSRVLVETAASVTRIDRDRRGNEIEEDVDFEVRDLRRLDVLALRQDWSLQVNPRNFFKWGLATRRFDTAYDYRSVFAFDNPLAALRFRPGAGSTLFQRTLKEDHHSLYAADRMRLGDEVAVELGLRYDEHTQTSESLWSPRANLAWSLGPRSVLRAAWGRFHQSQRPYELPVEDGETRFSPVERSEHRVLGFEHLFAPRGRGSDVALRVEVYRREVFNPIPRFENLYERINAFPELEPERVRVAPERSVARGLEIFVRSRLGSRVGWWANYAYATTEDEIDGRFVPRYFDQTHALTVDFDLRLSEAWTLNLAWRYHTGWPTTPLTLRENVDEEGESRFEPVLGEPYSERLPAYHRLDLRARRQWRLAAGDLELFFDVQNVYDRGNIAGFDYEIDEVDGTILPDPEKWLGLTPSFGIAFEF